MTWQELQPEIRNACAGGDFSRAQGFWEEYAARLGEAISAGSLSAKDWAETGELVEWAGLMVKAFRAQAAERLNSAHAAGIYGASPEASARVVHTSL